MFNVTLTKLIFKCSAEGGGGGGGGGVIKHSFAMLLACKKIFCVTDICIVYNNCKLYKCK